ncbi:MAG: TetR/AcrR family transcriptional regulator [Sedimentitalea sp.]
MTKAPQVSSRNKKTDAILDAAQTHFASRGFEATKLAAIARDADVAVGTIYLRFEGKAELLGAVLARVEDAFGAAMDQDDVWDTPFPERFQRIMTAILRTADQEKDLAKLMAMSSFADRPHQDQKNSIFTRIEAHLRDGMAREKLRQDLDPALAAQIAHGMVEGAMRALMLDPERDPKAVVACLADASWRWLRA